MKEAANRLMEAMGVSNKEELARKLHISRKSAQHIFTDNGVADRHLVLAAERGFHPHWIKTGDGPKYLIPSHFPHFGEYPRIKVGQPGDRRPCPNATR